MFDHFLNYAQNELEKERIRQLIQYLNSSSKPRILIYKNIILVNYNFVIVNEKLAKELLKYFSHGFIDYADSLVSIPKLLRRVWSEKKRIEVVTDLLPAVNGEGSNGLTPRHWREGLRAHNLLPLPVSVQPAGPVLGPLPLPQNGSGLSLNVHHLEF